MANSEEARSTGKVSWFNDTRGYGFIKPDDEKKKEELFVHHTSIHSDGFRSLTIGESVEFTVAQGSDGKMKAVDVTAPGGLALNKKKEVSSRGGNRRGGCFHCGGEGHMAKDCTGEKNNSCYKCGELTHFARDCVQKLAASVGTGVGGGVERRGDNRCYTCGDVDHFARDCIQKLTSGNVGSDKPCYTCGETGHLARDCGGVGERRVSRGGGGRSGGGDRRCYNCGNPGHLSRDCDNNDRVSGGGAAGGDDRKCYTCGNAGHMSRDCDQRVSSRGGGGGRSGAGGGDRKCYSCGNVGHLSRDCTVA